MYEPAPTKAPTTPVQLQAQGALALHRREINLPRAQGGRLADSAHSVVGGEVQKEIAARSAETVVRPFQS